VIFLRQVQAKYAVYVNMYYYKVVVRGWEVALLDGTVHVITALYWLMYSTVNPRFTIHWHMKYRDKVPCKSYVLFRKIIYQGYAREGRIHAGRYLLPLLRCFYFWWPDVFMCVAEDSEGSSVELPYLVK